MSLYYPFQESDVYFMSTACGRPQGGGGSDSCGQVQESNKSNFFVDIINGWSQWKVVLQVNGYFNIICLVDELSSYREDLFTPGSSIPH